MKGLITLGSHILIVSLALVCILILVSFVKNPEAKKIPE
jgi:hypothetical protein